MVLPHILDLFSILSKVSVGKKAKHVVQGNKKTKDLHVSLLQVTTFNLLYAQH